MEMMATSLGYDVTRSDGGIVPEDQRDGILPYYRPEPSHGKRRATCALRNRVAA
ncbi:MULTISPECIES: hypothetical protein [unclassified Nocardioides]|uniref:hypothetical protein n=1 Tax=unclassified Nocardioides TaxID=2615069 RepID=UPI0009F12CDD|nr:MULTISPECIES: hypothetical protein [unclassified Nocardioides]GAW52267.1 uncharacterized protein PD653B2_4621 [Nocardioides sp. PD653-B2]GAW56048.1 uncharacterized protein PD653_3479 [Nocardioides sp. PD653]